MRIYLGLGSNLGERRANLAAAIAALGERGIAIERVSPVVESPALLPDNAAADWNRPYLNLVVECRSDREPLWMLQQVKQIEAALGRDEREHWAPRPIDIDILLWGRERIDEAALTVPHPRLLQRNFVLTPLISLEASMQIPGYEGKTVLEWSMDLDSHIPLWMGIVNLTPDSFSDGGRFEAWPDIRAHVDEMIDAGAQIVDLGAESTRPGAKPLDGGAEWSRLGPVLERLAGHLDGRPLRPMISVDTYHADVAAKAIAAGADMINDVGGLCADEMIALAAGAKVDWVAMHQLGLPADPRRTLPANEDPVAAVERWLEERLRIWDRAGLNLDRIVFDPGIGFGKNALQSLQLLRAAGRFRRHGLRCLIGHSRKSFLQSFAGQSNAAKDLATVGASMHLAQQGVDIIRVHNVPAHVHAYRGWSHLA